MLCSKGRAGSSPASGTKGTSRFGRIQVRELRRSDGEAVADNRWTDRGTVGSAIGFIYTGSPEQFGAQSAAAFGVAAYSFVLAWLIGFVIEKTIGLGIRTGGLVGVLRSYCNRKRQTSDLCSLMAEANSSKPRVRLPRRRKGKSSRKLSPDVAAEIFELYQNGMSAHDIAERLSVHRITVSNYLDRASIPKRPKGLTDQQTDEAVIAYKAGDSFATIGRRFGFSPMTISLALRNRGAEIRPRPGYK